MQRHENLALLRTGCQETLTLGVLGYTGDGAALQLLGPTVCLPPRHSLILHSAGIH